MKDHSLHRSSTADIAIIGMAGFFPQASNPGTYWHNILQKKVTTEEIPPQRWDWRRYYDADFTAPDKVVSRWGAFLPDIVFDPLNFGITPNSLNYIEVTQLLTLESTRLALADAGYAERPFDRERASVFIGTGAGEGDLGQMYSFRSLLPHYFGQSAEAILSGLKSAVPDWNPDVFTGVITNIAAGRVANRFNLGGTNCTIDAACASALAALRAGVMELRAGESDMVIVGGADTLMSPFAFNCFSKVGALSPQGECRAFDEKADGVVLGEVVATVILKRLADAQADGDRVYAVVKGIAASSDGRAKSLTAPSREGQLLALKRAYNNAGVDPKTVALIEAHGTGTKVGDQSEAEALSLFFGASGMAAKSCAVGSAKSMIGHAKCAAGIASLIKTVLALHHKVLPPTWGVETPISEMDMPDHPLYLNMQPRPWIQSTGHPRRAGVSAFGFGGTNFHVVLEETQASAEVQPTRVPLPAWDTELLVFKASDRADLLRRITALKQQLQAPSGEAPCTLKDLAFTLASQPRTGDGVRLAIVAGSLEDLREKLAAAEMIQAQGDDTQHPLPAGSYFYEGAPVATDQIAFVFPGQGSQYTGMLRELAMAFGSVRQTLERFDDHLQEQLPKSLSRYIYPPDHFSAEARKFSERDLTQTFIAQPAMGAVDAAMLGLLDDLGVRPAMSAGHSYGEYAALYAAGVLDEQALALISEARGRFILDAAQPEPGTMAAVKASEKEVARIISGLAQVWIANLNAPQQTVISGTQTGVRDAIQKLGEHGLSCMPIPVACAFHSPIVAGAQERLGSFFSKFEFRPARIPVFSNTTAALFPADGNGIQALLGEQLVRPVRFVAEIEAMYAAGARLFVEVGAGNVLTNLIGRILAQRPHTAVCTDIKGRPSLAQLQHALARLAVLGVPLKLETLFNQRDCRLLDLEQLADPTAPPLSKTAYIIGQGGVRPVAQPARPPMALPRAICFADELPPAPPEPSIVMPSPRDLNNPLSNGETMDSSKQAPIAAHNAIDTDVMAKFQDLMGQFLETQRAVMTAYLNGGRIDAGAVGEVAQHMPSQAMGAGIPETAAGFDPARISTPAVPGVESVADAVAPTLPMAQPAAPAPLPGSAKSVDVTGLLLNIVSDRTGYPTDMLDLSLEIESDLGIDSIKRVQITETLVAALETQGTVLPTEELSAIASSVTLGEIITKLQVLIDQGAPGQSVAQPVVDAAAVQPGLDVAGALIAIVSERTGYPADMLDVNLEIESDLGIDSIKRVQITESLVAALESQGVVLPSEELAAIAGSVTLGEIITKLQALIDQGTPGQSVAQTAVDAAAVQPGLDVAATLIAIVSERTGYPADMLDVNLEIESDLGIDSIKRVQITESLVAALESQGVVLPSEELAAIAGSVTLGEIITKLGAIISRPAAPPTVIAPPESSAASQSDSRAEAQTQQAVGVFMAVEALYPLLFRLIQQHTGFPKETLSPELAWHLLDLDANEKGRIVDAFVAAVADETGVTFEVDREQGIATVSLRQAVEWMAAAPTVPVPDSLSGTRAIRRFILTGRENPLVANAAADAAGRTVLVTHMPDDPLADGVVARLRELKIQPLRLTHGSVVQAEAEGHYSADLSAYEQVAQVMGQIRRERGSLTGLLCLAPLSAATAFEQMTLPQWRRQLALEIKSLFYLTKLMADDLATAAEAGGASVVAVTSMGEGFGSVADPSLQPQFFPGNGAVTGFLKTLAVEIPGLNVRALDLDPKASMETRIGQIVDEWTTPCAEVEIAYLSGRRITIDAVEAPIDAAQAPRMAMDSSWHLLVTGGARGITATIAQALADRFQPTLLLVGRTPLTAAEDSETEGITDHKALKSILMRRLKAEAPNVKPKDVERAYSLLIRQREVKQTLVRLKAAGAQARYFEADVTDETSFGRVLDTIYQEYGRIDGVLHGAGLIEDKMVRDKDVNSFSRVFDTKADSLFILSRKLRQDQLRFLALFSSVAGRFGNAGQADYAAANEVYNKAALFLNSRWPGRVVSLMWGPWESRGMVSDELRRKFEAHGVSLIPPQVGTERFLDEIVHGDATQAEVIFGGWDDRKRAVSPTKAAEQLPLFFINANFRPPLDGRVDVVRRLDTQLDLCLVDHQLDGRPVVPMAMAMEMMAEAAAYRYPEYQLQGVSDMKVYRGIVLKGGCANIRIVAAPQIKSDERVVLSVLICDPEKEGRIYYEALLELGKEPVLFRPHVGIELSEPGPFPLPLDEAYQKYLFHGPLWQGIEEIQSIGKNGIIGCLKISRPAEYVDGAPDQARWLVDPLIIDSGLQLVGLWLRSRFDITSLPSQLKKYTQYCPAPSQGPLRCEVRMDSAENKGIKQADLYFIKPDGHLFARMHALEVIGTAAFNRLSQR